MMMRKYVLYVLSLLLLSMPVFAAEAGLIRVDLLGQDPDPIRAGDVVEVRFRIENWWEDTTEEVTLEVVQDYPFSVYGDSNKKNLGRLEGRKISSEAVFADFKLRVDPEAVDGEHELIVNIYNGKTKIAYKDQFFVDIEHEKISLKPYIAASDIILADSKGSITIDIANSGGYTVEALELELLPSPDYKLLSTSSYVYIGDVDADDIESEDFDIYVDKNVQQVKIPLRLSYEVDDHAYTDDHVLTLNLLTTSEAKKLGLVKSNMTLWIVVILVALVVGYFVYRKRFRKR